MLFKRLFISFLSCLMFPLVAWAEADDTATLLRDDGILQGQRQLSTELFIDYQRSTYSRGSDLVRRDELKPTLITRYGFTPSLEFGINLPYTFVTDSISSNGLAAGHESSNGVSNIDLSVKYHAVRQVSGRPDVVLMFTATPGVNKAEQPSLGWHQDRYRLSALFAKVVDPAIFFAQLGYTHVVPETVNGVRVDSGNLVQYRLGSGYAFTDRVTFSMQLVGDINRKGESGGQATAVTHSASLQLGNIIVFPDQWFIEPSIRFGLTPEAPDFGMSLAMPINF